MKGVSDDIEVVHLGVRDFDAGGVGSCVELRFDAEPRSGAHAPDQLDDGLVIDQRSSSPVFGDVAEESMLDLVPLGGAGRKVRDADREARAVGESLEFQLPESSAIAIAAPAVSRDEQFGGIGVGLLAHVPPPAGDGLHGELRGVMVDAYADPCSIRGEVIDAVGNRLAEILVDVQRRGDSGSPRVTGSTSDSKAFTKCGLVSSSRGLPPPGRRTWTTSSARAPARSSSRPPRIVVRDIPVARSTAAIPPSPYASASAPAHRRFSRSSITGSRALNFVRISHSVAAIPAVDHTHAALSIPKNAFTPATLILIGLFLRGA